MITERLLPDQSKQWSMEINSLQRHMKSHPCRDALVTRRDFLHRCGAGLLATALGGTALAALAVAEYRRGGMTYRRLGHYPYSVSDGRETTAESGLRVLRGGAFIEPLEWYDPAARHGERPNRRLIWNGLRLARSIPGDVIVVLKPKNE